VVCTKIPFSGQNYNTLQTTHGKFAYLECAPRYTRTKNGHTN
jgi:hypothetical protein